MLMLYLFKVEVFDLGLNYSYSSDCVVIADTHEDRGQLIRCQFGEHNRSVVKHSVLVGARALTLNEVKLLEASAGASDTVWLVTRVSCMRRTPYVHPLPTLHAESYMLELQERFPELYDSTPLMDNQYMQSVWFSKSGLAAGPLRAAA
ncbi:MAG: hypothetical protein KGK08_01720 [Acidobacteriota bacterium]|nr:hypothetical protein [Acidobacteriota bacterium]